VKAITLTQPWATLVAIGAKRFETRSWQPRHLGPIAIHAAKGFPPEAQARCCDDMFYRLLFGTTVRPDVEAGIDPRSRVESLPLRAVIATARLEWSESTDSAIFPSVLAEYGTPDERDLGNYSPGRWAWYLTGARPLPEPVQARGALWLWEWTPPADLADGEAAAR
jgi:activating signal cointegrator 1